MHYRCSRAVNMRHVAYNSGYDRVCVREFQGSDVTPFFSADDHGVCAVHDAERKHLAFPRQRARGTCSTRPAAIQKRRALRHPSRPRPCAVYDRVLEQLVSCGYTAAANDCLARGSNRGSGDAERGEVLLVQGATHPLKSGRENLFAIIHLLSERNHRQEALLLRSTAQGFIACRGVAQPGRAPGSGPGGRRFKSSLPDHNYNKTEHLKTELQGLQKGSPKRSPKRFFWHAFSTLKSQI